MKTIPINHGLEIIVDDEDYAAVSAHRWTVNLNRLGEVQYPRSTIDGKNVLLHRFIITPPPGMNVDHKDRNKLNACRSNLRPCTHQQNTLNRGPNRGNKYKGVRDVSGRNRYGKRFFILVPKRGGGSKRIGYFDSEVEAAKAYDKAVLAEFNDGFSYLNFPEKATVAA